MLDNRTDAPEQEYSLEAILAEFGGENGPDKNASEEETRSRRIVMEALGETIAAGRADSDAAGGTEGLPSAAHPERRRQRGRRNAPAEPARNDDDDEVREYRPSKSRAADDDDSDMRIYGLENVLAEAERTSAKWNLPGRPAQPEAPQTPRSKPARSRVQEPEISPEQLENLQPPPAHRIPPDEAERRRRIEQMKSEMRASRPEAETDAFGAYDGEAGDTRTRSFAGDDGEREGVRAYRPGHGAASGVKAGKTDGDDDSDMRPYMPGRSVKTAEPDRKARFEENAGPSLGASLLAPIVSFLAMLTLKFRQNDEGVHSAKTAAEPEPEEDLGPELPAAEASKYYGGHANSLKMRVRLAAVVSAILAWISFGLPVAGALRTDLAVASIVCLIMELSVVMLGLDVFTAGMSALLRGRPGLWSLVSFSCVVSALDAAVTAATGVGGDGLPFCAVSALSMTFAIWGSKLSCEGFKMSMKALALSEDPYSVTAESGSADEGVAIVKSKRDTAGYVNRCEEPDCTENAFRLLAPVLMALSVLFALIAAAVTKRWEYFFHILAAISAACAPFAAFLAFPLPYSLVSALLFRGGSAIAGWPGACDIGRSKHVIVTDSDIFPPSSVSFDTVRIIADTWPEKVISAAGSIVCASGCGLAPLFAELMRRNSCSMQRVEDFKCNEGGGMSALINGERVLCGNAGFMQLMGVRLPQKMSAGNSLFIVINGTLSGRFDIKYVPYLSVQDALRSLLRARRQPVFAIRDSLVTPLMIHKNFRIPTDGLDFPPFPRRYEISSSEPGPDSQIASVISREGLGPLVGVYERGRSLYMAALLGAVLSVVCAVVGAIIMFWLFVTGGSPTVGTLMTYMFLWLVPIVILTFVSLR